MEEMNERRQHNVCLCSMLSLAFSILIMMYIGVQTDPLMNFSIICAVLAVGALAGVLITQLPENTKQIYTAMQGMKVFTEA